MAWEWSHTPEAYDFAREHLVEHMDPAELRVMWAEWKASNWREVANGMAGSVELDADRYEVHLRDASPLGPVRIARDIWEWMEEFRTCTNGGSYLYGCPFGCEIHLVPVGPEE